MSSDFAVFNLVGWFSSISNYWWKLVTVLILYLVLKSFLFKANLSVWGVRAPQRMKIFGFSIFVFKFDLFIYFQVITAKVDFIKGVWKFTDNLINLLEIEFIYWSLFSTPLPYTYSQTKYSNFKIGDWK